MPDTTSIEPSSNEVPAWILGEIEMFAFNTHWIQVNFKTGFKIVDHVIWFARLRRVKPAGPVQKGMMSYFI
jgi:hypothetical protein